MSKKCPKCHKPPILEGLVTCPICRVPFVETSELGLDLSKEELDQIAKNLVNSWRFWIQFSVAFLVALLLVGVPTVTVIGVHFATKRLNTSLERFNQQASNHLVTTYQDVTNWTAIALQSYEQKADEQLVVVHQDMTNRIATEFKEPRINVIVSQVAATQATNLLNQQISPEIDSFRLGISNTLAKYDDSLRTFQKQSTNALGEVRSATEFSLLVVRAMSDNYDAFDKLSQISRKPDSPYREMANQAVNAIMSHAATEPSKVEQMGFDWNAAHIDPAKDSFDQLRQVFATQDYDSNVKIFLLKAIFDSERFPKVERIDFTVSLMTNHPNLTVRNEACYLMSQESKINKGPTGGQDYLNWWATNRSKYTNTPVAH